MEKTESRSNRARQMAVNNLAEKDAAMTTISPSISPTAEKIWAGAREMLRSLLNPDIFNLWFAPLRAVSINGDTITIEVANDFCELWLRDNYGGLIQDAVTHAAGRPMKVIFQVNPHGHGAAPAVTQMGGDTYRFVSAYGAFFLLLLFV